VSEVQAFDARELFAALARLEMKRATGRPQDVADVRLLESLEDENG